VVLFVRYNELYNPDLTELCLHFDVTLILMTYDTFTDFWPHILKQPNFNSSFFRRTNIAGHRFGYIGCWLSQYALLHTVRYVFVVDFRDTIFQENPFSWMDDAFRSYSSSTESSWFVTDKTRWNSQQTDSFLSDVYRHVSDDDPHAAPFLFAFSETHSLNIRSSHDNRNWVFQAYGTNILNDIESRNVICAGTVMGNVDGVLRWVQVMVSEIERLALRVDPYRSFDQGIHMVVLHQDYLFPLGVRVFLLRNEYNGIVFTMATITQLNTSVLGQVKLTNSLIPAVLHQYDRFVSLEKYYALKYAPIRSHQRMVYPLTRAGMTVGYIHQKDKPLVTKRKIKKL